MLMPLGAAGLHYFPVIVLGVIANLSALYFSYRQTAAAYPDGGGAYIVAKDNLGRWAGLGAAVAGHGIFYYVSLASIFIVLTYSAQTGFTDFPRVCRLLAEPHWWEYLLHNLHGARLKTMFYLKGGERVIVIRVPWHLRDV